MNEEKTDFDFTIYTRKGFVAMMDVKGFLYPHRKYDVVRDTQREISPVLAFALQQSFLEGLSLEDIADQSRRMTRSLFRANQYLQNWIRGGNG